MMKMFAFNRESCIPCGCLTQRAPDGWDSARFGTFPGLWQFSVSEPFSPQPPVTLTVRRCGGRIHVQWSKGYDR